MYKLPISLMLQGGDRRSIGKSREVAARVLQEPTLLDELLLCAQGPTAILRSRATHALMQVAEKSPELLTPHIDFLLKDILSIKQWEVRAHVCQTLDHLPLSERQVEAYLGQLQGCLEDKSSIVRTCAMQSLANLCEIDPKLYAAVHPIILACTTSGTAAMRARGRKLLKALARRYPTALN